MFGTTGEGNSLTVDEKIVLLEQLVAGGIPPLALMPGTGACAIGDTVRLTKAALALGVRDVLVLPPFYYKIATDDGLYDAYAHIIEGVADPRMQLYFYHIPQVSGVAISPALIARLKAAYPATIAGIKDSSRNWETMEPLCAIPDFRVFAGTESLLLPILRAGGVGCIAAIANVQSAAAGEVYQRWREPAVEALHARMVTRSRVIEQFPVIASLKAMTARRTGHEGWTRVRPPLRALDAAATERLFAELDSGAIPA